MTAKTLMVQGTSSSVGKSVITAALCRLFTDEGLSVAPFKAQNMALNAYVTRDGGEIGRAQAVQAAAARVVPTVDMNPILLKPEAGSRAQVVVLGKARGGARAVDYERDRDELRGIVRDALSRLRALHDLVVIEGAGSPVEVNLKDRDVVNMFVAETADAPVILVGDIDRGGVFASFVGTLSLLSPGERARVGALLVNRFRGDVRLFEPGVRFLAEHTGIPVLGVVPHLHALRIADEDSVALSDRRNRRRASVSEVEIAVVCLPHVSNHDDFLPLEHEPGVVVRFVENPRELEGADLVVLPGTKSTVADLAWLRETGMAEALVRRAARAEPVLGICGGCQILGRSIRDPEGVESDVPEARGLELLPAVTRFGSEKRTRQVRASLGRPSFLGTPSDPPLRGYFIHQGRIEVSAADALASFVAEGPVEDQGLDGAVSPDGVVVGTLLHGLFENASVRTALLRALRTRRGLPEPAADGTPVVDEYDRLASVLREHVDLSLLHRLIGR
ncbi:MAG TPA: cobyric acid synthase [Polyangiaceae bacterium]|nr:cobyric acid synthase [Polyangiaceae bacterium]